MKNISKSMSLLSLLSLVYLSLFTESWLSHETVAPERKTYKVAVQRRQQKLCLHPNILYCVSATQKCWEDIFSDQHGKVMSDKLLLQSDQVLSLRSSVYRSIQSTTIYNSNCSRTISKASWEFWQQQVEMHKIPTSDRRDKLKPQILDHEHRIPQNISSWEYYTAKISEA